MGRPISVEMFHRSSEADRTTITEFFDAHPDLELRDTFVVQVVAGGLKVTEFVRGEDGKFMLNLTGDGAVSRERVVKCVLPYDVSRCLHDMANRDGDS